MNFYAFKGGWVTKRFLTEFRETFIWFLLCLYFSNHAKNSLPSWVHFLDRARAIFEQKALDKGRFLIISSLQNIHLKIDKISKCFEKLTFISFLPFFVNQIGGKQQESKLHIKLHIELKLHITPYFLSHSCCHQCWNLQCLIPEKSFWQFFL